MKRLIFTIVLFIGLIVNAQSIVKPVDWSTINKKSTSHKKGLNKRAIKKFSLNTSKYNQSRRMSQKTSNSINRLKDNHRKYDDKLNGVKVNKDTLLFTLLIDNLANIIIALVIIIKYFLSGKINLKSIMKRVNWPQKPDLAN